MNDKMPRTPFSTPLSGSAKETERRLRNIFEGPKKRPPMALIVLVSAVCLLCGNLVSCQVAEPLPPPDLTLAPADLDQLPELDLTYSQEGTTVQVNGLEDVWVEWNRASTGNYLYFAGDPAFCCPSLAGRTAEGSARWQDEPWGPVVVSISVNDDRLEDGTIDGYSLNFVVDWPQSTVLESSFTSEIGDGVLELSEKELLRAGWIMSRLMDGAEWAATADVTVLDCAPDLNRNGVPEEIRLIVPGEIMDQQVEVWEDGQRLFVETGAEAHAGWNALFLCTLDGEEYLLAYHPIMYQGSASYSYELFTLEGGEHRTVRENYVEFDVGLLHIGPEDLADPDSFLDVEAVAAFMEEINELLSHSVQLLNTDTELLETFQREGRLVDTLGLWFDYDHGKSMEENLRDYRDEMIQQFSQLPPPGRG